MSDTGTINFVWSQAMIAGFVAAGVTDAVISPGSRSTPLALAMLRQSRLRCHVAIDERSAAFFALGLAKSSQGPVMLLATSGSAPANWLPAVVEASHSGIPLILISADRPPELQNCGANQTINQANLFGSHVRACHLLGTPDSVLPPKYLHQLAAQACEQASWPHPGPVHINQPFREPLLPSSSSPPEETLEPVRIAHPVLLPDMSEIRALAECISGQPGIIVCGELPPGEGQSEAIAALAARLKCPVLAEPLSGLRFGQHDHSHLCVRYNDWLGKIDLTDLPRPEWVIRFGSYPVTRNLQNFISGITATHTVVTPWPRWIAPSHQLTQLLRAEPAAVSKALLDLSLLPAPESWLLLFLNREAEAQARESRNHIHTLLEELPINTDLFIGNSLAIRQMDTHTGCSEKPLRFHANRGASGIDGNISTAAGIAADRGLAVALIGDLTCQHDIGGLALTQGLNIVIVVVNNAGGGIFDHLPQRHLPEFVEGWRTPQQINFEHAARTFGLGYALGDSDDSFRHALRKALAIGGPHLIELKQS